MDPARADRATLSVHELGSARNLIAGGLAPSAQSGWLSAAARALVVLSLGGLLAAMRGKVRELLAHPGVRFCALLLLLHIGLVSVLWLYADRYYLALLPALVACVLVVLRRASLSVPLGAAALAIQIAIGIVGTRDALHYNDVCRRIYASMVRAGVRPYDIDAGWSFNGWMLYAQRNIPPGIDPERDIPAVTSKAPRPYLFAKAPIDGYRPLLRVRWKGWVWPSPNEVYVLRRETRLATEPILHLPHW